MSKIAQTPSPVVPAKTSLAPAFGGLQGTGAVGGTFPKAVDTGSILGTVAIGAPLKSVLASATSVKAMNVVGGSTGRFVLNMPKGQTIDLLISSPAGVATAKGATQPSVDTLVNLALKSEKAAPKKTVDVNGTGSIPGSSASDRREGSAALHFDSTGVVSHIELSTSSREIDDGGRVELWAPNNRRFPINDAESQKHGGFYSNLAPDAFVARDLNDNQKIDAGEVIVAPQSERGSGHTSTAGQLLGLPGAGTPDSHL